MMDMKFPGHLDAPIIYFRELYKAQIKKILEFNFQRRENDLAFYILQ